MGDPPSDFNKLEQMQLALQMAGELNQIKTGLLAQTAHELRSPLGSLMSLLQLILNDLCENPQEERDFLQQAYGAARRLMATIDELVKVSKIDCGAIAIDLRPVELRALLEEVYSLVRLQAANRNIRLTVAIGDRSFYCLADGEKLLSVLVVLLDSAIRHQEGGYLELSADPVSGLKVRMPSNDLWQQPVSPHPLPDPLTLSALEDWSREMHLSAGMQWQLAQRLIARMGGKLSYEKAVQAGVRESQWYFQLPQVESQ